MKCVNHPRCQFTYSRNFTKPFCPLCEAALPGLNKIEKTVPKPTKMTDEDKEKLLDVVQVDEYKYSVKHHLGSRGFVKLAENSTEISFCEYDACIKSRTLAVKNKENFECKHIKSVLEAKCKGEVGLNSTLITKEDILTKCSEKNADVVEKIEKFVNSQEGFVMLKLNKECYTMTTPVNSKSHIGLIHVKRKGSYLMCSSMGSCERLTIGVGKRTKTQSRCPHEEICYLFEEENSPKKKKIRYDGHQEPSAGQVSATTTPAPLQTEEPKTCSQCGKSFSSPDILKNHTKLMHGSTIVSKKAPLSEMETQNHNTLEDIIKQNSKNKSTENLKYLKETSKWIFQTEKKNFSEENIGSIQRKIMKQNEIGWPSVFSPEVEECPKCGNKEISQPQKHQGSKRAFFLTRGSCSPITIMVRKCRSCFLLIQPKPPLCLNIGDNLIVTLDVMYLMRSMVHTCAPLSTAAEVVIADLSRSCAFMEGLTGQEKEWIRRRLTAGFLALEALDKDEEESQICGLCGIVPDMALSDGGEDICVTLKKEHMEVSSGFEDGIFTPEDATSFVDSLKIFHIGALVYPRLHFDQKFPCNISNTPPFLLPAYRGTKLYNTETKKDTTYLEAKVLKGEQQLLSDLLENGDFHLSELDDHSTNKAKAGRLNDVLKKAGFCDFDISQLKSNAKKKEAIMNLYESITSGYSQCHHTGNRLKASGGWYLEMCPHGVTTGAKFLYCSESVRDVMDLKLSRNYVSPTNVLDTACTASAHLLRREPEIAKTWFGDRRGCFEKPVKERGPVKVSLPDLEPSSHKKEHQEMPSPDTLQEHEHPLTGKPDKYFCGDRFHDKRFPHKSQLCRYHDINLVPQLNTSKTSEQENVNSMRNRLRLRSTCTQNLGTHLFYNGIVMDRAHNRAVVKRQADQLQKSWANRHPDWKHII